MAYGPTRALAGANIAVARGEIVAIVGPSGSGKSTLLYCLAGIIVPDNGAVLYRGRRVDTASDRERTRLRREEFGFVLQFGQLVPELTARENIALPLQLIGRKSRQARSEADEWLEKLDIASVYDRTPGRLSGGQQQRVAVARALIRKPAVLFADEPTGALDSDNGKLVLDKLVELARLDHAAVVLVTHDEAVAAVADRRVVVHDGLTSPA